MISSQNRFRLPRIHSFDLRRFSLFSRKPNISTRLSLGVYCLAGANGLGKSTYIAALNFALTGIVPEPGRRFASAEEYFKHSHEFSQNYFAGRIVEGDRRAAEVSVKFTLGDQFYHLVRGVFEPDQLRGLTIRHNNGNGRIFVDGEKLTAKGRLDTYQSRVSSDIGLESFEQFVFLQNYIFTFDERRHLLFWDHTVLEQVLYMTFGVSPKQAQRAEDLRRESERAGSLARNANWQAAQFKTKIQELESAIALSRTMPHDDEIDAESHYKALTANQVEVTKRLKKVDSALSDITVRIADLSAQLVALRGEYEREYSRRLQERADPRQHPVIKASIATQQCGVCGTTGDAVGRQIQDKLNADLCPLCASPIVPYRANRKLGSLQKLDEAISQKNLQLRDGINEKQRLSEERNVVDSELDTISARLDAFEKQNEAFLKELRVRSGSASELDGVLARYREQMAEYLAKKKTYYRRRDDKLRTRAVLQKKLIEGYASAEEQFVPMFKDLAENFLGLDLGIRLDASESAGVSMVLEVKDTARREVYQLSESQRFFIDIALRMALIQYMSDIQGKGCLLVDTPEGALDIAYESRAGDMFARFVAAGFQLIMTANINSSQLLLALAKRCGSEKMGISRMTEWTELSKVQLQEEGLFEKAYQTIQEARLGKPLPKRSSGRD